MRSMHPPAFAHWLLRNFGFSPSNEAVIGDLDERYRQGRSRLWYWRQALQAIAMGFCQDVWAHKLLALRALLLGWIIKFGWLRLAGLVIFTACNPRNNPDACRILGDWHWQWFMPLLLASITASVALCITSVWLVARMSGRHYRSMVILYILVELLAVPVMINAAQTTQFTGAVVLVPGGFSMLWAAPFATYFYVGLAKAGYPFETVISLWCGCILMTATMLLAGRMLRMMMTSSLRFRTNRRG
jgi:hypothetical protein